MRSSGAARCRSERQLAAEQQGRFVQPVQEGPCILGIVLGGMLEANFVTSMIKADGDLLAFFARPIAAGLGVFTILVWTSPLTLRWWSARR